MSRLFSNALTGHRHLSHATGSHADVTSDAITPLATPAEVTFARLPGPPLTGVTQARLLLVILSGFDTGVGFPRTVRTV